MSLIPIYLLAALLLVMPSATWTSVVTRKNYPLPGDAGQEFRIQPQLARCVKIEGTRLRPNVADQSQYRMQFAEIAVYIRNPTGPQSSIVNIATGSSISTSSSYEYLGWSQDNINDGQWDSVAGAMGWSSANNTKVDHPEWIGLDLGDQYLVQSVILYPRNDKGGLGQGFPIDFNIQFSTDVNCFD